MKAKFNMTRNELIAKMNALEDENADMLAALKEAHGLIDSLAHGVQFDGVKVERGIGKILNTIAAAEATP